MTGRACQYCGSSACEWEGNTQLGCTDCGFDAPFVPTLEQQVAEDTCSKHNVFLCHRCFDLTVVDFAENRWGSNEGHSVRV